MKNQKNHLLKKEMVKENNKKKLLVIIALFLSIFIITGCKKEEEKDSIKFKQEYESINGKLDDSGNIIRELSINDNNPIIYSTAEEIVNKINNKETFLVYFGYASDARSRCIIEPLIKVSREEALGQIYYVDISSIRNRIEPDRNGTLITIEKGTDGYNKLLELLNDYLYDYVITNSSGETITVNGKRIYSPSVISIVKGEFDSLQDGMNNITDPYMELSDDIITGIKDIFRPQVKKIAEEINSCDTEDPGC